MNSVLYSPGVGRVACSSRCSPFRAKPEQTFPRHGVWGKHPSRGLFPIRRHASVTRRVSLRFDADACLTTDRHVAQYGRQRGRASMRPRRVCGGSCCPIRQRDAPYTLACTLRTSIIALPHVTATPPFSGHDASKTTSFPSGCHKQGVNCICEHLFILANPTFAIAKLGVFV